MNVQLIYRKDFNQVVFLFFFSYNEDGKPVKWNVVRKPDKFTDQISLVSKVVKNTQLKQDKKNKINPVENTEPQKKKQKTETNSD
jgi:hypothetical protein